MGERKGIDGKYFAVYFAPRRSAICLARGGSRSGPLDSPKPPQNKLSDALRIGTTQQLPILDFVEAIVERCCDSRVRESNNVGLHLLHGTKLATMRVIKRHRSVVIFYFLCCPCIRQFFPCQPQHQVTHRSRRAAKSAREVGGEFAAVVSSEMFGEAWAKAWGANFDLFHLASRTAMA